MREWDKPQAVDSAFDQALIQALIQALARAEAQPPAFLIPPEIPVPPVLTRSLSQVGRAMDISRSAFQLAFNFL